MLAMTAQTVRPVQPGAMRPRASNKARKAMRAAPLTRASTEWGDSTQSVHNGKRLSQQHTP